MEKFLLLIDNLISDSLKDDILPAFKDIYYIDGKLYAMPMITWSQFIVINKYLVDKYGLSDYVPGPGGEWTPEEFETDLKKMKEAAGKDNVYPFCMECGSEQGDYYWWKFIWGFGVSLFDKNGKVAVDSPETVAAYKYILSFDKQDLLVPGVLSMTGSDTGKMFQAEKMFMNGGNAGTIRGLERVYKDGVLDHPADAYLVNFPTKKGIKPIMAMGSTGFIVMAKDSEKQKATAAYIEFELQQKYAKNFIKMREQFTALKSIADLNIKKSDEHGEIMGEMIALYPTGNLGLSNPNYNKIRVELSAAGTAAALAVKQGVQPRQVKVSELLKVLKEQGAVIN